MGKLFGSKWRILRSISTLGWSCLLLSSFMVVAAERKTLIYHNSLSSSSSSPSSPTSSSENHLPTTVHFTWQSHHSSYRHVWPGLEDEIKLVPINLQYCPAWYKEKVYPRNEVPVLEHNNKLIPESVDLIKYVDTNFEGPSLFPHHPSKRQFGEELLNYAQGFNNKFVSAFQTDNPPALVGCEFDYLENALSEFDDGPFFLGQFSLADIAYAPFLERFKLVFPDVWKYDITAGRPKLATWIEELNKIEAYTKTKVDPKLLLKFVKLRFEVKK